MKESLRKEGFEVKSHLECIPMELGNLASVRRFAEEFRARKLPLHILFNNAGKVDDVMLHGVALQC